MKKIVLSFLLIGVTGVVFGQETTTSTTKPQIAQEFPIQKEDWKSKMEKYWKKMKKELNLTSEQDLKVQNLYENHFIEVKKNMEENKKKMQEFMQSKQEYNDTEMKKILTPEQYTKWKGMMEHKKAKLHKKFPQKLEK